MPRPRRLSERRRKCSNSRISPGDSNCRGHGERHATNRICRHHRGCARFGVPCPRPDPRRVLPRQDHQSGHRFERWRRLRHPRPAAGASHRKTHPGQSDDCSQKRRRRRRLASGEHLLQLGAARRHCLRHRVSQHPVRSAFRQQGCSIRRDQIFLDRQHQQRSLDLRGLAHQRRGVDRRPAKNRPRGRLDSATTRTPAYLPRSSMACLAPV